MKGRIPGFLRSIAHHDDAVRWASSCGPSYKKHRLNEPNFENWISEQEAKEIITVAEAADLYRILDDTNWTCTVDSMVTDIGRQCIGIRDSSDVFWVSVLGRREAGVAAADIIGGITGLIWGGVGAAVGAPTMSYLMSEAIEMAEAYVESGCGCTCPACQGDFNIW